MQHNSLFTTQLNLTKTFLRPYSSLLPLYSSTPFPSLLLPLYPSSFPSPPPLPLFLPFSSPSPPLPSLLLPLYPSSFPSPPPLPLILPFSSPSTLFLPFSSPSTPLPSLLLLFYSERIKIYELLVFTTPDITQCYFIILYSKFNPL